MVLIISWKPFFSSFFHCYDKNAMYRQDSTKQYYARNLCRIDYFFVMNIMNNLNYTDTNLYYTEH